MTVSNKSIKIQMLRAIAIIAVVMIHTCNVDVKYQIIWRPFVNYAVALFIFLSGYLTKIDNKNWFKFYIKRISRVCIPYVIWTIIYTLPSIDIKEYIYNLVTTKSNPTLYYIFVYIQFVLLSPLIGKLATSKYRWIGFFIAPLAIVSYKYTILLLDLQPHPYINLLWDISSLGWFSFFYLGVILGNQQVNRIYKWKLLIPIYFVCILIQIIEGYIWCYYFHEVNCGTQMKISALITNMVFLLMCYNYIISDRINFESKLLKQIGFYSFGIYFIHIVVIEGLRNILFRYESIPHIFKFVVVFLLSYTFAHIIKQICREKASLWIGIY